MMRYVAASMLVAFIGLAMALMVPGTILGPDLRHLAWLAWGTLGAFLILGAGRWDRRTPGWWWTRLELAMGIVVALFTGWSAISSVFPQPCFGCGYEWPLPVPLTLVVGVIAMLGIVVGLVWMIRILRGPRDDPPPWRYRDR